MTREKAKKFVAENVLGSTEVQEMLLINRSRLKAIVDAGKLVPIKELKRESLYLFADVEQLKKEMLLDTRTNLYKRSV